MAVPADGRRGRRVISMLVATLLAVAGCTYDDREPGLFGEWTQRSPSEPPESDDPPRIDEPPENEEPSREPPPPTHPGLPVVGESVWTSADGLAVQVRLAVHAVRRVEGGTVLDWSVTPIKAPNLRPGDAVPPSVNLGLSRRGEGDANIFLIDAGNHALYRPLVRSADNGLCLCTPIWIAKRNLRIGVTTVLQTGFPELPADLRTVDVDLATVPQFWRVPVTPAGRAPVAIRPTDLTRLSEINPIGGSSKMFRFGPSQQVFRLQVQRVVASSTFTSVEWAIVSVTGGDGIDRAAGPPFASAEAGTVSSYNPAAASGPALLRGTGSTLHARISTSRLTSDLARECLCTDLRVWAPVLRRPDKVATVVTNYAALPPGTRRVEVAFPGMDPIRVNVSPAVDASNRSAGPIETETRFWRFSRRSLRVGWESQFWPTPVPRSEQFADYTATVDELVR